MTNIMSLAETLESLEDAELIRQPVLGEWELTAGPEDGDTELLKPQFGITLADENADLSWGGLTDYQVTAIVQVVTSLIGRDPDTIH